MPKRFLKLTISVLWFFSIGIPSLNAVELLDSNCESLTYQSDWTNYSKWNKAPYSTKYLLAGTTISCRAYDMNSCVAVHSIDNTVSLTWADLSNTDGSESANSKLYKETDDYTALKAFRAAVTSGKIVVRSTTDDRYMVKDPTDTATKAILAKIQGHPTSTIFNWLVIFDAYQYIVDKVNNSDIDKIKNTTPDALTYIKKPKDMVYSSCAKTLYAKGITSATLTAADLNGCFAYQAYCTENFALAGLSRDIHKMIDVNEYCIYVIKDHAKEVAKGQTTSKYKTETIDYCKTSLKDNAAIIKANLLDLATFRTEFQTTIGTQKPQTLKYFNTLQTKYQKQLDDIDALMAEAKKDLEEEKNKETNSFYTAIAETFAPKEPDLDDAATIEQQMDVNMTCIMSNDYTETTKTGCANAIEYAFANKLLKADTEKVITTKLVSQFELKGDTSKWAAIVMSRLANYYPTESSSPTFYTKPKADVSIMSTSYSDLPSWREASMRSAIIASFKSCIIDANCPIVTKEGITKGWGYLGPSAVTDITDALAVLSARVIKQEEKFDDSVNDLIETSLKPARYLNKLALDAAEKYATTETEEQVLGTLDAINTPGRSYVSDSEDANTATLLFHALGYIYHTQNDYSAKAVLLKYMRSSGINSTYPALDAYSLTLGVNAAFVATYYGMNSDAEPYLESIALWHSEHTQGVGAIPIDISKEAWSLLPNVSTTVPEKIKKIKDIPEPTIGTAENIMNQTEGVLTGTRNGLAFLVMFDVALADVAGISNSLANVMNSLFNTSMVTVDAAACSFAAADLGYLLAENSGSTLSYELTIALEQRMLAEGFAETTTGKILNTITKPLRYLKNKFGGSISNVKSLMFKNKIPINPLISDDITLGSGIAKGSGSIMPISENYIAPSTASSLSKNTIYIDASTTAAKLPANTYVLTAEDFAKYGVAKTANIEDISSIVESIAPKQASSYMNSLKPVTSASSTSITESTVLNTNGILNTISPAKITIPGGQVINGLRIISSVIGAENAVSASVNSLYYQDAAGPQVKMNIEYPDGTKVPVVGDDVDEINNSLKEYNKYCADAA